MKKQITAKHPEGFIRINISTDGCVPNQPYFSITADLCRNDLFTDRGIFACGCFDEILSIRPDLKPFVGLHLSNLDGVPMHAEENGFYWLAKAAGIPQKYKPDQSVETCTKYLQSHLRLGYSETLFLIAQVATAYIDGKDELFFEEITPETRAKQEEQGIFRAKTIFKKEVESMKPRWKAEAEAAISFLESL